MRYIIIIIIIIIIFIVIIIIIIIIIKNNLNDCMQWKCTKIDIYAVFWITETGIDETWCLA